jgi:CBS domain-containing protein/anti-sigma regulatory factor (Ser/Thr protein kinase)
LAEEKKITKIQEFIYELKVNQVMTEDVIFVTPETNMRDLREILRSKKISGVPVSENSKLVGLISIEDFIKWLADGQKDCSIAEKMTREVQTIYADSPLIEALNKFDIFRFGRFPVIDRENDKLVGVLTKGDIIRGLLKKLEVEYLEEEIHTYRASHIFEDIVADKAILRFQYWIKGSDFKHAGECASGLKRTLKRLGFHPQTIRRVAIATYEAEMNMIIFAEKGEITAEVELDRLRVRAQDIGPGIEDIEKAIQPGYSTAPDWVRELGFGAGMGLYNIKKCSDQMNIASTPGKGTQVEFGFALAHEGGQKDES